jgi:hypothetical protein
MLTLTRGAEALPLDPEWVTRLSERGLIDPYAKAPDLARWRRRALRRLQLDRAEEDPDGFAAEFDRLTARDRAASSPWGVALFKFSSPEGWIVSRDEADRIVQALAEEPEAEALVAFARGGAFEVR